MKVKVTEETRSLIECKTKLDSLFDDVYHALAKLYGEKEAEEDKLLKALNQLDSMLCDQITESMRQNIGQSTDGELVI